MWPASTALRVNCKRATSTNDDDDDGDCDDNGDDDEDHDKNNCLEACRSVLYFRTKVETF